MQIDCKKAAFLRRICLQTKLYYISKVVKVNFRLYSNELCYVLVCSRLCPLLQLHLLLQSRYSFSNIDSKCLVSKNAGNFYDSPPEYEKKVLYCQLFCLGILFVAFSEII